MESCILLICTIYNSISAIASTSFAYRINSLTNRSAIHCYGLLEIIASAGNSLFPDKNVVTCFRVLRPFCVQCSVFCKSKGTKICYFFSCDLSITSRWICILCIPSIKGISCTSRICRHCWISACYNKLRLRIVSSGKVLVETQPISFLYSRPQSDVHF